MQQAPVANRAVVPRFRSPASPGYTLSASGLSPARAEVFVAEELSLSRSPDAPIECEKGGLGFPKLKSHCRRGMLLAAGIKQEAAEESRIVRLV
jgi:hypothetical protein